MHVEYIEATDYVRRLESQLQTAGYTGIDYWYDSVLNAFCAAAIRPDGGKTAIHTHRLGIGAVMSDLVRWELEPQARVQLWWVLMCAGICLAKGHKQAASTWLDDAEDYLARVAEMQGSLKVDRRG